MNGQADAAKAAPQPDPMANSAPNPYKTIEHWAKLPEGRTMGSTSAVEIDKDGYHWSQPYVDQKPAEPLQRGGNAFIALR